MPGYPQTVFSDTSFNNLAGQCPRPIPGVPAESVACHALVVPTVRASTRVHLAQIDVPFGIRRDAVDLRELPNTVPGAGTLRLA